MVIKAINLFGIFGPVIIQKKLDSQIISFQFRWRSNQFHQMFDNTANLAHSISPKIGLNYPSNFNRFPTCSSSIGLTNPANFHQWSFNSINVTNSNHFPISQIQSISIIWMFSSINPIKVVWKNGQLQPMPPNVHQLNQLKRFNQFRPAWLNWRHKNKLKCKIKTWNERNIKSKIKNREKKKGNYRNKVTIQNGISNWKGSASKVVRKCFTSLGRCRFPLDTPDPHWVRTGVEWTLLVFLKMRKRRASHLEFFL